MNLQKDISQIHTKLKQYREKGLKLFTSSSFQTHSIPLLHILSQFEEKIPVYFLNTGFHFPETLEFRDQITELLNLNLIELRSPVNKTGQMDATGRFLFSSDPNHCCYLNKVLPLEPILRSHDVWISGLRADQNLHRKNLTEEERGKYNTLRYHPILNWNSKQIWEYRNRYDLPEHPLNAKGYFSIGCEPCTQSVSHDEHIGRSGRWAGMKKSECGIHTELKGK